MTLKLVHDKDADAKALGMKIAKTKQKSITNGAISKYGDIVKADYQEGICGHIEWTVSPLIIASKLTNNIALKALQTDTSKEEMISALKAIIETNFDGRNQYNDLLKIKRLDHETTDTTQKPA